MSPGQEWYWTLNKAEMFLCGIPWVLFRPDYCITKVSTVIHIRGRILRPWWSVTHSQSPWALGYIFDFGFR